MVPMLPLKVPIPTDPAGTLVSTLVKIGAKVCRYKVWTVATFPLVVTVTQTVVGATEMDELEDDEAESVSDDAVFVVMAATPITRSAISCTTENVFMLEQTSGPRNFLRTRDLKVNLFFLLVRIPGMGSAPRQQWART